MNIERMRIVFVSDTHGLHNRMLYPVPAGDVLVHCGDMTRHGSIAEIGAVAAWMAAKPHRHKLAIGGNHDAALDPGIDTRRSLDAANELWGRGIVYLQDASAEIDGVKFYGSPWTPEFMGWHFMLPRDGEALKQKWDQIPDDTQVLITHGPAYGIGDLVCERYGVMLGAAEHAGCKLLGARIAQLEKLRVHACGHIHEGYGVNGMNESAAVIDANWFRPVFVNAATCNRNYEPVNRPIVVDL